MPNIITHKLFAQEVLGRLEKRDIQRLIERYPQIYYIGSNGPDFLFFYHAKPWEAYKSHMLNRLGGRMHSSHVNAFYRTALSCIKAQKNKEIRERMSVYLFGHLCHWALDAGTHPYIFYRTGNCRGKSRAYHHRFESMLDTLLLEKLEHTSIQDYRAYEICEYDEAILQAIARIYVPVAREVFHMDVKVYDLREALNAWYDIQRYLYDPSDMKYTLLHGLEKLLHKEWYLSGHIVRSREEDGLDILNEEKREWKHPCEESLVSTASFMELYETGVQSALQVIEKAYGCIEYGADITKVEQALQNRAYDTGMAEEKEKLYFDILFEK